MHLRVLTAAVLLAGSSLAADRQLLSFAMPDARLVVGINVERARTSPFGQFALTQVQEHEGELQALDDLTGFDPRRDLREVLLITTGQTGNKSGIAVARGTFNSAKIVEAAIGDGQTAEVYKGVQIINNPRKDESLAFLDATLVIGGDSANVHAAVDRRSMPATLDPGLVSNVERVSAAQDLWFVSLVPPSTFIPSHAQPNGGAPVKPDLFKNVQQADGGVKFGANVLVSVQALCQTEKDAAAVAGVIRFLSGMAKDHAPQGQAAQLASLLQYLSVDSAGNVATLSLSIPEDQVEQLIQSAHRGRTARLQ